jgi:hypothetical protein
MRDDRRLSLQCAESGSSSYWVRPRLWLCTPDARASVDVLLVRLRGANTRCMATGLLALLVYLVGKAVLHSGLAAGGGQGISFPHHEHPAHPAERNTANLRNGCHGTPCATCIRGAQHCSALRRSGTPGSTARRQTAVRPHRLHACTRKRVLHIIVLGAPVHGCILVRLSVTQLRPPPSHRQELYATKIVHTQAALEVRPRSYTGTHNRGVLMVSRACAALCRCHTSVPPNAGARYRTG